MLRSARERIYQTLAFEAGGLLLATPLYALVFGQRSSDSFLLLAILSCVVMAWSPLHNTVFDWLDLRLNRRAASDRPHGLRLVHATSHEFSSIVATLPLVMLLGGHGFGQALAVNAGLTLLYAAYAYGFHILYDLLRPVRPPHLSVV
jgi:uncharacterized membrane protein